jgi:hypothetical protein
MRSVLKAVASDSVAAIGLGAAPPHEVAAGTAAALPLACGCGGAAALLGGAATALAVCCKLAHCLLLGLALRVQVTRAVQAALLMTPVRSSCKELHNSTMLKQVSRTLKAYSACTSMLNSEATLVC